MLFARFRRATVEDGPGARQLEHEARNAHAVQLVDQALAAQADLADPDDRDVQLIDLCLELRSALAPKPVDAYIIQELPRLRPSVPVIPGRSS